MEHTRPLQALWSLCSCESSSGSTDECCWCTYGSCRKACCLSHRTSIDYQRQQAKAMQKFLRERNLQAQMEKSQCALASPLTSGWTNPMLCKQACDLRGCRQLSN